MKKGHFMSLNVFLLSCIVIFLCSSCGNTKAVTYFNNIADTSLQSPVTGIEPVIQKGDLLSISVSSTSPDATTMFNTSNTPASNRDVSSSALSQAVGYLVSQNGTIDFPMLGTIQVVGMSKETLKDLIKKNLEDKKLLFDPIVTVRYLNFHVTVLGEVNHPGVVNIPNEQGTLLEALGLAGDLTIYGKRENVLLIRKENGQKVIRRLNLLSENVLNSPYYYLKSNDVIYVTPSSNKVASVSPAMQWAPIILSTLSFLVIIGNYVIFRR
jgi:polysaccharide export outer membrane protein